MNKSVDTADNGWICVNENCGVIVRRYQNRSMFQHCSRVFFRACSFAIAKENAHWHLQRPEPVVADPVICSGSRKTVAKVIDKELLLEHYTFM
jgi:hypothetical protein